ncbi:hypothetical protein [Streptomyces sp. NPDC003023]|uniref:hypothetical protein n=1 Tax=Streptomyces sp. NPDC003023 TaxID=3364675 RepID=UPI0036B8840E
MPSEVALVESRAMRVAHAGQVEALDKVKALTLLPDSIHVSTEGVARYFEVSTEVIKKLTQRHREELTQSGMRILRGSDLGEYQRDNMSLSSEAGGSYPQRRSSLTLFSRRTVLNVAMLLRDSDIARRVRTYLLDAEQGWREGYASLDGRVTNLEQCLAGVGTALQELGPVLNRMSQRLDRLDHRLDATNRVVAAMSNRLCELSDDMVRMDARMDDFARQLRDLRRRRRG